MLIHNGQVFECRVEGQPESGKTVDVMIDGERTHEESRAAFDRLRLEAPLELRLGFELTPAAALLEEDPHRYLLEGTDCVLMEVPFSGPPDLLYALAEHVEAEVGFGEGIVRCQRRLPLDRLRANI